MNSEFHRWERTRISSANAFVSVLRCRSSKQVGRLGDELREKENTILRHRLGPDWTPNLEVKLFVSTFLVLAAYRQRPSLRSFLSGPAGLRPRTQG